MRTFIATEADESTSKYLRTVQQYIKMNGLKNAETFHLTFHFLGEIDEQTLEKVKQALSTIHIEPIKVKLDGIGYFPETGDIRVVWVGLRPEEKIRELQKKIDDELINVGIGRDTRFKPHMTIARVKFVKSKKVLKDRVRHTKIEPYDFTISKIKLMKSTLTEKGSVFELIQEF